MTSLSPTTALNAPGLQQEGEQLNQGQFALRQTNVSSPSVIHPKSSQQSITASEDYYSLSSRSTASTARATDDNIHSNTIHRFTTPPSRYRTPAQSRDQLPSQSQVNLSSSQAQYAADDSALAEVRRTPMRGEGRRRLSSTDAMYNNDAVFAGSSAAATAGSSAALREGGIRRKPVPSTVIEAADSPRSQEFIDPTNAQSSVARDLDREQSPVTPGQDDTTFIRFALDQLTRDEEVRGSRRYPGQPSGMIAGADAPQVVEGARPYPQRQTFTGSDARDYQRAEAVPSDDHGGFGKPAAAGAAALGLAAAATAGAVAYNHNRTGQQPLPTQQWPDPSRRYDELPPRHPRHVYDRSADQPQDPDIYQYVDNEDGVYDRLNFVPGILRLPAMLMFILLLMVLLALLMACAIWSLTHKGIFDYGSFGDGTYFIFQYLPLILAMLLLVWVIQIQVAIYRVAPFIAMASSVDARSWEGGAQLPIYPKTWFLPYFGHFRVPGLAVAGFFMLVAWFQIWTIPLLASAFNVYFFGEPSTGNWRWVATAGLIWIVIALYLVLLVVAVVLMLWTRKKTTGLKWDPRSLADMIVILERSNALSLTEDDEIRHEPARLGHWRTSRGNPGDVFHAYGIADKPARQYAVRDGRLTEKRSMPGDGRAEPKSRFSDFEDVEMGREQRNSREKMLPRRLSRASSQASSGSSSARLVGGNAVPWFLHTSTAILWIIIAVVLLIAFLVVSYLPSTTVANGFNPMVAAPVNSWGFSFTNFLYSFVPALLAMILFVGVLDIDYAYRRLQPFASLTKENGELAEKSLLLSYPTELPLLATASAMINSNFRVALFAFASLLAIPIPVVAGGCFWAQFDIATQNIKIYAHMPAYYALTFFVVVVAIIIASCVFPSRGVRSIDAALPRGNTGRRWTDIVSLLRSSRLVDDVLFRAPATKVDLVTRLLSAPASAPARSLGRSQGGAATASKISVADSVRGFGRARQAAAGGGLGAAEVARFSLGGFVGRDGERGVGIDRVRL